MDEKIISYFNGLIKNMDEMKCKIKRFYCNALTRIIVMIKNNLENLVNKIFNCVKSYYIAIFLIISLGLIVSGYYLIVDSKELDEYLDGRNYHVYFDISNETDKLDLHNFNFRYDFSTNKGSIKFRTLENTTATNIKIIFIPGIFDNSIEVNCGENIDENNSTYHSLNGTLLINTTGIYSDGYYTHYSINFSSNWTPKGTFHFNNVNKDTKIHRRGGIIPNVEFVLKDKYKSDLYNTYFNNLEITDYSEDNYVQVQFPENVTKFSGSLKLSAIDREILYEKDFNLAIGISLLVSGFIFILSICYDELKIKPQKK